MIDRAKRTWWWWIYEADPTPVVAYLLVWLWGYSMWLLLPHSPDPFEASRSYRQLSALVGAGGWGATGLTAAAAATAAVVFPVSARLRLAAWVVVTLYWGTVAWTMAWSNASSTGTPAYSLAAGWSLWVWWRWVWDAQHRRS